MIKVAAANWKMNHGPGEALDFFEHFRPRLSGAAAPRILVFPPSVTLQAVVECPARAPGVDVGVQNVHWEEAGAFTGETSAPMAREVGATHALIGHSERRHLFGETDEDVRRKVGAARRAGLVPVVCVGETLEERRAGLVRSVILRQLDAALAGLEDGGAPGEVLLAYEPVWAIGTGETATPEDASEAHGVLRSRLAEEVGEGRSGRIPILYGGSVKPENALELLGAPDVDGVLVGGASLKPDSFASICEAAQAAGAAS